MHQIELPCLFMRAGTSRGPFFNAADLPADRDARHRTLIAALGASPDGRQLDGLGGGDSLTSKVAIVGRSTDPGVDVEYRFAQVAIDGAFVDDAPSCGNMLSGVAPYAIETGMVAARDGETTVRIRDVNGGAVVEAVVQTPGGMVTYVGDTTVDGVPGAGAPIRLNYRNVVGSKTGRMFPTGQPVDVIDGVAVTCIDVATPMMLVRAADFGLSGIETPEELNARTDVLERIERLRQAAGWRMGLGDVSSSVLPKVAILSVPRNGGAVTSRYLTPWRAHAAHAVTGAICVAAATAAPGTIAAGVCEAVGPGDVDIEHPAGKLRIRLDCIWAGGELVVRSAGVVRTARLLMRGAVAVPAAACASAETKLAA